MDTNILLTGASGGVGKEVIKILQTLPVKLLITSKSEEKLDVFIYEIKKDFGDYTDPDEGASRTTIAVLDTGVQGDLEIFEHKNIYFKDFIGRDFVEEGDLYEGPVDVQGHGTITTSIIAASSFNSNNVYNITLKDEIKSTQQIFEDYIELSGYTRIKFSTNSTAQFRVTN